MITATHKFLESVVHLWLGIRCGRQSRFKVILLIFLVMCILLLLLVLALALTLTCKRERMTIYCCWYLQICRQSSL